MKNVSGNNIGYTSNPSISNSCHIVGTELYYVIHKLRYTRMWTAVRVGQSGIEITVN